MGVLEIATAFVVSALFVWSCRHVDVDAIDRMGQVSGIAAVEWRFVIAALVIFAALAIASRGPRFELASRFACAALAGLASATVAGGVAIMLHRTKFGLGAIGGDAGILIDWAEQAKAGKGMGSSVYPPLQIYLLAGMSKISGIRCAYLLQLFQIMGVAAMGPAAYAAWRLVLKSKAALAISVISVLPMIECYRQYPLLVLVITIPVLVKFLAVLRDAAELNLAQTLRYAAMFGVSLGLLFLLYSGWYQWSGPGFVVAAALVFPWRTGWRQGAILCGVSALIFGLLAYHYVTGVVTGTGVKDDYVYFDATVEPMFVAIWKGGLPGVVTLWPPLGELGGVGLFTVLLSGGLAIAVAYGR
ncbi:MAG TPA: hypothetical protein VFQ65_28210, partial [Kofleriaceae bacterium]|nr:hypothetical protein [Kofleriaceae bacterium]